MAVAKKRKFATARGMSSERASESGLPWSRLSMHARSLRFGSMPSESLRRMRERSSADVRLHDGNALFAAATAASMSEASLSGTSAIGCAVAGLMSAKYAPLFGATNSPPMKFDIRITQDSPRARGQETHRANSDR